MTARRGPMSNVQKNAQPPKRPGKFQVRVGMDQMIRSADAVLGQDRPTTELWTVYRYPSVKRFTPIFNGCGRSCLSAEVSAADRQRIVSAVAERRRRR
jgi:hypothetical protein